MAPFALWHFVLLILTDFLFNLDSFPFHWMVPCTFYTVYHQLSVVLILCIVIIIMIFTVVTWLLRFSEQPFFVICFAESHIILYYTITIDFSVKKQNKNTCDLITVTSFLFHFLLMTFKLQFYLHQTNYCCCRKWKAECIFPKELSKYQRV